METILKKRKRWTPETLKIEALKYSTRGEFQKANSAYQSAYKYGILDEVCSHMPKRIDISGENNPAFKWTLEMIKVEALKYKSRTEFYENNAAYQAAQHVGVLDEVCSHMELYDGIKGPNHYKYEYTEDKILNAALNYTTRTDFSKGNNGEYNAARRSGILDKVCKNMKLSRNTSKTENSIMELVKTFYPNTKKHKDFKVEIEEKPYIKGFEIDIFIPELMKGIEFDGIRYHSYKFMRNDPKKSKWSDDDIRNYHQLKDDWFKSKGIEILHIKEEKWNENKELCIQEILAFLKQNNL